MNVTREWLAMRILAGDVYTLKGNGKPGDYITTGEPYRATNGSIILYDPPIRELIKSKRGYKTPLDGEMWLDDKWEPLYIVDKMEEESEMIEPDDTAIALYILGGPMCPKCGVYKAEDVGWYCEACWRPIAGLPNDSPELNEWREITRKWQKALAKMKRAR